MNAVLFQAIATCPRFRPTKLHLRVESVQKGAPLIRSKSIELMDKIQSRWSTLLNSGAVTGAPTLCIAETLPAELLTNRSHAHA
jgi:hypothetical protein